MASATTPSRRDGTKDNNLAQWTTEIRKLQTEVDMEAEEESRRLQEEIAASRIERERRRANNRRSTTAPVDYTASTAISRPSQVGTPTDLLNIVERQTNQTEALRKLVGDEAPVTPTNEGSTVSMKRVSMPTSLASIIGGTATGPRLNKHAPQANAHDPTQFSTSEPGLSAANGGRIRPSTGVALPGLQNPFAAVRTKSYGETSTPARPVTPPPAEKPLALPAFTTPPPKPTSTTKAVTPDPSSSHSSAPSLRIHSPTATPGPAARSPQPPSSPSRTSHTVVTPPPLARQIRSSSSSLPQLPDAQSTSPSPAFLRPLPPKDLTPSLTRLQGRGFVSQRVQLGGIDPPTPSSPLSKSDVISPSSSGRKLGVLSRWPAASSNSLPESNALARSFVKPAPNKLVVNQTSKSLFEAAPPSEETPPVSSIPAAGAGKPYRNSTSVVPTAGAAPFRLVGLVNSRPLPEASSPSPVTQTAFSVATNSSHSKAPVTGKSAPLSHPTRDRARRPKRSQAGGSQVVAVEKSELPRHSTTSSTGERSNGLRDHTPSTTSSLLDTTPQVKPQPEQDSPPISRILSPPPVFTPPAANGTHKDVADLPSPQDNHAIDTPSEHVFRAVAASTAISSATAPAKDQRSVSPVKIRALPGLSAADSNTVLSATAHETTALSRRRTVMDIAQGMQAESMEPQRSSPPASVSLIDAADEEEPSPKVDVRSAIAAWGKADPTTSSFVPQTRSASTEPVDEEENVIDVKAAIASWAKPDDAEPPQSSDSPSQSARPFTAPIPRPATQRDAMKAERRRSNIHEKYASIILPPLAEENTPAPTPFGSLARREGTGSQTTENGESNKSTASSGELPKRPPSAFEMHQALLEHKALIETTDASPAWSPLPPVATTLPTEPFEEPEEVIELPKVMEVTFDVQKILRPERRLALPAGAETISVEVLLVTGKATSPVDSESHIFYDVEVRAIVHRYKSSGLVSMRVYGWRGRQAEVGSDEAQKLGDLASRFRTTLIPCIQGSEPEELVSLLGGVLVTRQGPRAHWTRDNTAMHCVRAMNGAIYVDQVEPDRKNLCSAFSYVATLLDAVYIFHGRGATSSERREAVRYATFLISDDTIPTEFEETEEDEMFAMILGDDTYAMADFWKYRNAHGPCDTELFRVDTKADPPVQRLDEVAAESIDPSAIFVLDGAFEMFIIVGADARHQRQDISLAISVAQQLSSVHAPKRPFNPPVHIMILPSQIPLDLRVGHVRFMDDYLLNGGEIPDHMNLLSLSEAVDQLSRTTWPKSALTDPSLLPLGVSPEDA